MFGKGDRAPEFSLPDQDGREVSLTSLLNQGPLLLYFYPADFTPGCTRQACMIADLQGDIQRSRLVVAGISPQAPSVHQRFRAQYKLPYTLLSDETKEVIRMYGADGPLGFGVRRVSYLLDRARIVRDAVRADFRISRHTQFVRYSIAVAESLR
jgi:peroxiredoxin Q/BCP